MDERPHVRAFAFSTGGVDTVMQLGVAHALLVARAQAPEYVVGVSAGAINATALAEILQAGENLGPHATARERLAIKTDRLREYVNAYSEVPRQLADAVIPDSLEVINKRPLKPLDSPLHFAEERATRERANEAKAGLISLINDLFQIRLPFSALTVIVRRILGCIQAGELPKWKDRVGVELRNEAGLLATLWHRLPQIGPILCSLGWSALWGDNFLRLRRRRRQKATAGTLLTQWRGVRMAAATVKNVLQMLFLAPILAFITAFWTLLWAPIIVPLRRLMVSRKIVGGAPAQELLDRILAYYGVRDGLIATDTIKNHIVRCFDQKYYGETPLVSVLQRALDYSLDMNETRHELRKRLFEYGKRTPAVNVGIVAANVATGELEVLPPQVPVVDALCAAMAVVPFLPPVGIDQHLEATRAAASDKGYDGSADAEPGTRWYIDGANISTQAIGPLMDFVRHDLSTKREADLPAVVDVYPVSTLPISKGTWRDGDAAGEGLIHGALRAMQLRELRDATLERKLTMLYTDALPEGKALHCVDGARYVRANIYPIELDKPPQLQAQVLLGSKPEELRNAVHETVAKGCLAALEQMMPARFVAAANLPYPATEVISAQTVDSNAAEPQKQITGEVAPGAAAVGPAAPGALTSETTKPLRYPDPPQSAAFCRLAIHHRLGVSEDEVKLPGGRKPLEEIDAPGLPEICRHCALNFKPTNDKPYKAQVGDWKKEFEGRLEKANKSLQSPEPPEWPVDERLLIEKRKVEATPPFVPAPLQQEHEHPEKEKKKCEPLTPAGPMVSMLFGGGVFRGVFHLGVLNALNELHVQPGLVAGASVGAIVAAMIARVFTEARDGRRLRIARLAATFLSIDRLILTDRLADAVRRLTLRAGQTHFSMHDLDHVFRRYDRSSTASFGARLRKIAAGVERMLYVSPFELRDLTAAARENHLQTLKKDLLDDAADFLFRSGIGDEILGSEPLRVLIEHHVIDGLDCGADVRDVPLRAFHDKKVPFFATVTNMTLGRLKLLRSDDREGIPSLLFSLLASSAFPAVFRPRSSWEVFREPKDIEKYIDGGVIDNLPLDAVTDYLDEVLARDWRRPQLQELSPCGTPTGRSVGVPHLVFTASLEVDKTCMTAEGWDLEQTRQSCRRLHSRAKTFTYNRKVDAYARVQRDMRRIHAAFPTAKKNGKVPLDLHVLAVKPRWLCGTFGFHPMLGFKRWKQAASIAHGCASTLAAFFATQAANSFWTKSWGVAGLEDIDERAVHLQPKDPLASPAARESSCKEFDYKLEPRSGGKAEGVCWFRKTAICPFSAKAVRNSYWSDTKEEASMLRELPKIYEACGMRCNHEVTR